MLDLRNICCMELMKEFENNHFDLAICDPPYGIGAAKEKPHNGWADWGIKQWDNEAPDEAYFAELKRVSKNQIIWGANHFIERMQKQNTACWLIWDKGQRDFSLADGEMAWTSFDKAMRIFTYARAKALQEGKIHPTQKPKQLYKWILKNFAKEGDKILDTHLGSGSIAIAVDSMNKIEKLNLTLTASEIDAEYFERTMKRINNELAQTSLF